MNPYTLAPVCKTEFYGREELIKEILRGDNRRILIVGAPMMGKTSLLKELKCRLDDRGDIGLCIEAGSPKDFKESFECKIKNIGFNVVGYNLEDILLNLDQELEQNCQKLFLLIDEGEKCKKNLFGILRGTFDNISQIYLILVGNQKIYKLRKRSNFSATSET